MPKPAPKHARVSRDRRPLLGAALVAVFLAGVVSGIGGSAGAASGAISVHDHEGQKSDSTWTNGNVTTYAEGDSINFRFTVTGQAGASGTATLYFAGPSGYGCTGASGFFDGSFTLGSVDLKSGTTAPTVTPGAVSSSGGDWVVVLTVAFGADGEAVVNYTLVVSDDVSGCNGASTGTEFGPQSTTGDVKVTGTERVPVPANQIVPSNPPVLTVTKTPSPSSLPEPGGSFLYTVTVENGSSDGATLDSLTDDKFGNITQVQGQITATDCSVPQDLGGTDGTVGSGPDFYSCSFTATVTGVGGYSHTNTVTASASNSDGSAEATGEATVTVTDVAPTVAITKVADPDELAEPGGTVTYTLTVTNTSAEPVTITALTDDHALSTECLDLVGEELAAGESVDCSYTVDLSEVGSHDNTAEVTVEDDEGTSADASADATVTVTDVAPTLTLDKAVTPASLLAPGGVFTYTLTITNLSTEPVTIDELTDDHALSTECLDLVGEELAAAGEAGASVSCQYTVIHTEVGAHPNTASVTVSDDEGGETSADDEASVTVLPAADLAITKTIEDLELFNSFSQATYLLEITNLGPSTATGVVVTDQLPALVDFVSATADSGGSCTESAGLVECSFASLAVGETAVVEIVFEIDEAAEGGFLSNTAVVSGAVVDPNESNNSSTVREFVPEVEPQVVTPTPTETSQPTATPTSEPTAAPTSEPSPTPTPGGELPMTGSQSTTLTIWGFAMILLGALLVAEDLRVRRAKERAASE